MRKKGERIIYRWNGRHLDRSGLAGAREVQGWGSFWMLCFLSGCNVSLCTLRIETCHLELADDSLQQG